LDSEQHGYTRKDLRWILPVIAVVTVVIALAVVVLRNVDPIAYGN
jgi:flagellar basal body-associated protein FliL